MKFSISNAKNIRFDLITTGEAHILILRGLNTVKNKSNFIVQQYKYAFQMLHFIVFFKNLFFSLDGNLSVILGFMVIFVA
jgi:hypothetical protein